MTSRSLFLVPISALLAIGCALTSKNEAITPRYFSPEPAGDRAAPVARPAAVQAELRLGRIAAASHLDERIVYRDSDYELGYYQERRWTEVPDQYLRRQLSRVLFEERGLRHVVGGGAATLDVELTAFEEVRAPLRVARVRVSVRLVDQRLVRWEETLTVEQPVAATGKGDGSEAMVEALGVALRNVVLRIADRVVSDLGAPTPSLAASPRAREVLER